VKVRLKFFLGPQRYMKGGGKSMSIIVKESRTSWTIPGEGETIGLQTRIGTGK